MRLLLILPVIVLLACSSAPATDTPDPDRYLDHVRQMHAENRAQFKHLTTVTFAPPTAQVIDDPAGPTPTDEELKRDSLSFLAPRVADLSRVSRFIRGQLDELNAMAVPDEHNDLHADLIVMWEAGIAWVDHRLEFTQDLVTAYHTEDWEAFDEMDIALNSSEYMERRNTLIDRHANAVSRVNFVLFGTPEPSPFNASGTSTARAMTPLPPEPTAPLAPTPLPSAEPERLEITRIYEVRRLRPGEKVSQEEALFIHFRSWERLVILDQAAQKCGLYLDNFETRPVDTPEVRRRWNQMTADRIRYEQSGRRVADMVEKTLGTELHYRLSPEHWELVRPLLIEAISIEQEAADSVELLLVELECPY